MQTNILFVDCVDVTPQTRFDSWKIFSYGICLSLFSQLRNKEVCESYQVKRRTTHQWGHVGLMLQVVLSVSSGPFCGELTGFLPGLVLIPVCRCLLYEGDDVTMSACFLQLFRHSSGISHSCNTFVRKR